MCEDFNCHRPLPIRSGEHFPETIRQQRHRSSPLDERSARFSTPHPFPVSRCRRSKILSREGEDSQRLSNRRHPHLGPEQLFDPDRVAGRFPLRIKIEIARKQAAPKKSGARSGSQRRQPKMLQGRRHDTSVRERVSRRIDENEIAEENIHFRMRSKEVSDRCEGAGQVLFVAIEVGTDFSGSALQAAVDCVVHACVAFDEEPKIRLLFCPAFQFGWRPSILHNVFKFGSGLVGDRSDTQNEPIELRVAWRDDRDFHLCVPAEIIERGMDRDVPNGLWDQQLLYQTDSESDAGKARQS